MNERTAVLPNAHTAYQVPKPQHPNISAVYPRNPSIKVRLVMQPNIHPMLRHLLPPVTPFKIPLLPSSPPSLTSNSMSIHPPRRRGHNPSLLINHNPIPRHQHLILARTATHHRLPGSLHHLDLLALPPNPFQPLEIPLGNGRHVLPVEHPDFELLIRACGGVGDDCLRAGVDEVGEFLEDDFGGADMGGDFGGGAVVGDELRGGGEVDAVDVRVAFSC